MPDGSVLDAVPLDAIPVPVVNRGTFQFLEAFA